MIITFETVEVRKFSSKAKTSDRKNKKKDVKSKKIRF